MRKVLMMLFCFAVASPAHANLEIAVMGQMVQSTFTGSDTTFTWSSTNSPRVGALVFLPLFPMLSLRTGAAIHQRAAKGAVTVLGTEYTLETKDSLLEIPVNLQLNIPMTDAYVFGGAVMAMTQSSSCTSSDSTVLACNTEKTPNDMSINVGVGYNLISIALFRVGLEVEYQRGTKNLSTGTDDLKQSNLGAGVIAAFGF